MSRRTSMARLPVQIFKEGGQFIAYCPALDLSTCGASIVKAKKMFVEMLDIFLSEVSRMGTTDKVLTQCGWRKASNRKLHWDLQFMIYIGQPV
jgi:hypothetical protein